jgi:hypothetical protein
MNKTNKILLSVFVLQIILTGAVFYGEHSSASKPAPLALLSVDQSQIDHITIDDGKGKKAVLTKVNDHWQLPDYHQLPADQNTVKKALQALANIHNTWPVATTSSSHERFKVGDDDYLIRINLAKGNTKLKSIYLGTSPGFRQIHVRKQGQDGVYNVKLDSYDYSATNKYWLDHGLLRPTGSIASIEGPDYSLSKQGKNWQSNDKDKGKVDKQEVDKLISALTGLNVNGVVDEKPQKANYVLSVNAADKSYDYHFFAENKDYLVTRNDYPEVFKINKADFDKITSLTRTQLVKADDKSADDNVADKSAGKATAKAVTVGHLQHHLPQISPQHHT